MSDFTIYPAVDLRGGQVVRLSQGDPDRQTSYPTTPGDAARGWMDQGANWLHVINLDGAFGERSEPNLIALGAILKAAGERNVPVQFGGGVRKLPDIEQLLEIGVSRVILGTAAIRNPGLAPAAVERFGSEAVAVGVDLRRGILQVEGWTASSELSPVAFGKELKARGLERVVVTDVARDGTGSGLNVSTAADYQQETGLHVIAAGGVSRIEDVLGARKAGLEGVVIGKALYEGDLDLTQVFRRLRGGS